MTKFRIAGWVMIAAGVVALAAPANARAQMSLSTAVNLALHNSPKVRMAQADLDKARASLAESKDVYIPAVVTSGGIGKSAGVPLSLPVIFTISAQSLAFNFSQPDYIRAAHAGVDAAEFALSAARDEVVEDTITTYFGLDNAQLRKAALAEAGTAAGRLQHISEDRFAAGADARGEVTKARRTVVQTKLQALLVDDEIDTLVDHLHRLTGFPVAGVRTVHESIPTFAASDAMAAPGDSASIKAAFANATAKGYVAHGDERYRFRPQFALGAGYSRISTVGTNYAQYYRGFATDDPSNPRATANSLNSLDIGIQLSVPLLDYVHRAKARQSAADARRALAEAENARMQFGEGQVKLRHAQAELAARAELAGLDRDLAQDQLDAVLLQLQASAAGGTGPASTPKDEQNARLQERERYLDMLNADLTLRQTEINLMRQQGTLGGWLQQTLTPAPGVTGTGVVPGTAPVAAPAQVPGRP